MTVVVAYKWAANPADASVNPDGVVDFARAHCAVSEDDPVAIALGRLVADAVGTELVGVSVGASAVAGPAARKAAGSRGVDRGLLIADDAEATANLTRVGALIAYLVEQVQGADLLLTGEASIDENARMVPALAAGFLGWPCFSGVTAISHTASGWLIKQRVADGTRDVEVAGPVVAAVAPDAILVEAPGMADVLAGGRKPFEVASAAGIEAPRADVAVVGRRRPKPRDRAAVIHGGPGAAAALVAALRREGVL